MTYDVGNPALDCRNCKEYKELKAENDRAWADNFALAANQCHDGYTGEDGEHCCRALEAASAVVEAARRLTEAYDLRLMSPHSRHARFLTDLIKTLAALVGDKK